MTTTAQLDLVVGAIRSLRHRGEDAIYEVDVIIACRREDPSEIREAFRACVDRGWLEPSATAPCAFIPRIAT